MSNVVDYTSLSNAVNDWLARSDMTPYLGYFIQVAENRIYKDIFEANEYRGVRQMEAALTGTTASNTIPVPADYLGLKTALCTAGGNTYSLSRKNEEFIYTKFPKQTSSGNPTVIARSGSNFIFGPYSDDGYVITGTYWQKAASLSATNPTTWMITAMPETLLAAVMCEANKFLRDDTAANGWGTMYTNQLQNFVMMDKSEAWSGSSLAITAG